MTTSNYNLANKNENGCKLLQNLMEYFNDFYVFNLSNEFNTGILHNTFLTYF